MLHIHILLLFTLLFLYIPISIQENIRLEFCDHVTLYGVTCETHEVVTEDGYRLGVQRIGNGLLARTKSAVSILMWHGAICSADSLVIMGNASTPVQLALAGYDVWMGNSRGNLYSRKHTTLDPDNDDFWDFSFHEMALYDVPATIDFILKTTRRKKVSIVGHSQGTTIFFALGSVRPEYNRKIQLFIAMAPIAYMPPPANPVIEYVPPKLINYMENHGIHELFAVNSTENDLFQFMCLQGFTGYYKCMASFSEVGGPFADCEMTKEIYDQLVIYYFGGGSLKSWNHFTQISLSARFAYYNYGDADNLQKYGSVSPPDYDLNKVTMPVAMLCGVSDTVATLENVNRLKSQIPNVAFFKVIDNPKYNHYSFMASNSMLTVLNQMIFDLLNKHCK